MFDNSMNLKKCPHCGCRLVDVIDFNDDTHYVQCRSCKEQGPDYPTQVGAVYGWNQISREIQLASEILKSE